jgi:hypothetical protein
MQRWIRRPGGYWMLAAVGLLTDVPEERVRVYNIAMTEKAQDSTSDEGNK